MNYVSSKSSWNTRRWMRLNLKLMIRDVYINSKLNPLTKLTSSSRSTKLKNIFSRNISQMITKTVSISANLVISYSMKRGISVWLWQKVNGNWNCHMIKNSQWKENHFRTSRSVRRSVHMLNPQRCHHGWYRVANLSTFVPPDTLRMHSLPCLF